MLPRFAVAGALLCAIAACGGGDDDGPIDLPSEVPHVSARCEAYGVARCERAESCEGAAASAECIAREQGYCCYFNETTGCEPDLLDSPPSLPEWQSCVAALNSFSSECTAALSLCDCLESLAVVGLSGQCL